MARARTVVGALLISAGFLCWLALIAVPFAPIFAGVRWLSGVGLFMLGEVLMVAGAALAFPGLAKAPGLILARLFAKDAPNTDEKGKTDG
jgi:uncharacterized membrane protein YkgB